MRLSARVARWLLACGAVLCAAGCAVQTAALREHRPPDLAPTVELTGTPFFAQTDYQCGPAALATALAALGDEIDPSRLADEIFLPARTGTLQIEMMSGARRHAAVPTRLPTTLEAVLREVQAGHPVVVLQNLGLSWAPLWHYAVLIGYDIPQAEVFLRSGKTRREVMWMRTFEHTWTRAGSWAFVALPPGQWPATASEKAVIEASVGFERAATPAQAVLAYRSAAQRWPDSLSLQMGLGNSLYASGDKQAAAQAFRDAAERHHSAPAWINLASTLMELGVVPEALKAAQQAVALDDTAWNEQARDMLAQVRNSLGHPTP